MPSAAEVERLIVRLIGDGSSYQQMLAKAETQTQHLADRVKGIGVAIGGAVSGFLGVIAVDRFVGAFEQQRQATERLRAVLESTGHVAGVTVEQIERFATARQVMTNFGDEVTIQGAAVLATFRSVRGEAFERTLRAAQDLTETLGGGDLQGAIIQLGKAMESPSIGLTALRRSGVSFTQEQIEQIKQLEKTGQLMKAQTIILDELERQFGGVAERAVSPLTQLKNILSDVEEEIGEVLLPAVEAARDVIKAFVDDNRDSFNTIKGIVKDIAENYGATITKVILLGTAAGTVALAIAGTVLVVNQLVVAVGWAVTAIGTLRAVTITTSGALQAAAIATNLWKGALIGLAAYGIYQIIQTIRTANKDIEHFNTLASESQRKFATGFTTGTQKAVAKAQQIEDPEARRDFLKERIDEAGEAVKRMEGQLKFAQRRVLELDTVWNNMLGNAQLEHWRAALGHATERLEMARDRVKELSNELNKLPAISEKLPGLQAGDLAGRFQGLIGLQETMKEQADLRKSVSDLTFDLETQVRMFGKSSAEASIYKLRMEGASDAQLQAAKTAAEQLQKLERVQELLRKGEDVTKEFSTPTEQLNMRQKELKDLLDAGAISAETYGRAMRDAENEINKAAVASERFDAVGKDSAELQSRLFAFREGLNRPFRADVNAQVEKKVDVNTPNLAAVNEKTNVIQERIAKAVEALLETARQQLAKEPVELTPANLGA